LFGLGLGELRVLDIAALKSLEDPAGLSLAPAERAQLEDCRVIGRQDNPVPLPDPDQRADLKLLGG
jgi:hypothetical protein